MKQGNPLPRYDAHICLVSQQLLPNILPLLPPESRPDQVVLLVSSDMKERANLLQHFLKNLGCQVRQNDISPFDFADIRNKVLNLATEFETRSIALNATGGTKIMSLGATEVFRSFDLPVFYIDTDNSQFIQLSPALSSQPLIGKIQLKTYLAAYGYQLVERGSCQILPTYQTLCDHLIQNSQHYIRAIPVLHGCAAAAEKKDPPQTRLEIRHQGSTPLTELFDQFSKAGLIHLCDQNLYFTSEPARRFAAGFWLESYVTRILNQLKGIGLVQDHACNLVIKTAEGVQNEIDLAFTARNRLYLIECKAGKLSEKEGKEHRADAVAYKLDSLRDLIGGTYAKAMLVSFQPLIATDLQRFKQSRIALVAGPELKQLYSHIETWIQS